MLIGSNMSHMEMEEQEDVNHHYKPQPERKKIYVCKCLTDDQSSEAIPISVRKQRVLSTVTRTEEYLKQRRISELINFLLIKTVSEVPEKPIHFLENLLDDCMLYRAGHGSAPVIYEDRHLEAVLKSYDPGQRGWLTAGQLRRAYRTLGLIPENDVEVNVSTEDAFNILKNAQAAELFQLVSAGMEMSKNESSNTDASV